MLFRKETGELVEINRYDFLTETEYNEAIMEIKDIVDKAPKESLSVDAMLEKLE